MMEGKEAGTGTETMVVRKVDWKGETEGKWLGTNRRDEGERGLADVR